MTRRTAERMRLITPTLVSIALALLGLIYNDVRTLANGFSDLKERVARVEVQVANK